MKIIKRLSIFLATIPILLIGLTANAESVTGPSVTITGNSSFQAQDGNGNIIATFSAREDVKVTYSQSQYYISSENGFNGQVQGHVRFIPINGTILEVKEMRSVGYSRYRGILEIKFSNTSNRLWVINELSFRDYLSGIGEEPENYGGGDLDALMAAVIVYRSYAYAEKITWRKFGNEPFDISSSTIFAKPYVGASQWYIGYYRETFGSNLSNAVLNTNGICVIYNPTGAVAKTPFYSKSDGNTRSSTLYPWCQSVSEPYDLPPYASSAALLGHGLGMSMFGAEKRVKAGYSYEDVIKYYFSNISLSRIFDDNSQTIRVGIFSTADNQTTSSSNLASSSTQTINIADISFSNISDGAKVGKTYTVKISTTSDVKRVIFYLDGTLEKFDKKKPFASRIRFSEGQHTITIVGMDKKNNILAQEEITVYR
ncbi:MAG: hypothetical protein M1371_09310 [Actinobacteria bacterium]|nr:hypothetical protein [Actinomycetota bacterium]